MTIVNDIVQSTTEWDEHVQRLIAAHGDGPDAVIPILQDIQTTFHYLPEPLLRRLCELTRITPAAVAGVSTFYTQFRHAVAGQHIIHICHGTACHVKGADLVHDAVRRELRLKEGEDTDGDRLFTVEKVACLGCCTLAPVVQIDRVTYGHVEPASVGNMLHDFLTRRKTSGKQSSDQTFTAQAAGEIRVGLGSCCQSSGSAQVHEQLLQVVQSLEAPARIKRVGCVGMCHRVPLVEVVKPNQTPVVYDRVTPEQVEGIVLRHFPPASPFARLKGRALQWIEEWFAPSSDGGFTRHPLHVRDPQVTAFLDRQVQIVTDRAGSLDPLDLEDYCTTG
ncbi:MAG: NAD(P)H-dependent oxidoreductase subunit E, partial [candidate division KSB1 bacterium]|nr:NAD(P)H-dependent oxidoreductase subunit E [candidate division KSB1 bacterium]